MSRAERSSARRALGTLMLAAALLVGASDARAARSAPVKQVVLAHFGEDVDATTAGNVCTVASGHACQPGKESSLAGGFAFPAGVAVAPDGDLYVADTVNNRVQELTAGGEFVRTFGWEVNQTKSEAPGATQAEKNVCTAASGDACKAGVAGPLAGQISLPHGIAVDRAGNVLVQDWPNARVDEFAPQGGFVLMIGGEVNKTQTEEGASAAERNVCTAASGDECQQGVQWSGEAPVPGAFKFMQGSGNLLTVGGAEGLLYVGDEHRVQKFDAATGAPQGEIPLTAISQAPGSQVRALALDDSCAMHQPALTESTTPTCKEFDPEYGSLYLVYSVGGVEDTIRKFAPGGAEVDDGHFPLTLAARDPTGEGFLIKTFAVDPSNRLAVSEAETLPGGNFTPFGGLYASSTGRLVTEFTSSGGEGLASAASGELYGAETVRDEIVAYHPVPVAELLTGSVPCGAEGERETSVAYDCTLQGDVDPWGVAGTEVWFEWGETVGLGERTPPQAIASSKEPGEEEPLVEVERLAEGLRPNGMYFYRLSAYDESVKAPASPLSSEIGSFATPYVAPHVVGVPVASFVKALSASFSGEVNPENANTEYFFEYGPEGRSGATLAEACPGGIEEERIRCEEAGVAATAAMQSEAYEKVSFTDEARNLNPATKYRFRIFAKSENGAHTERRSAIGPEGEFATAPLTTVQAETGPYSSLTATSAVISASVGSGGQPATYTFELGLYKGAATEYGPVFTDSVTTGATPIVEFATVIGLQPSTEYAYRIRVRSGQATAWGEPVVFRTSGFPFVIPLLQEPSLLHTPPVAFPGTRHPKCKHGYKRGRRGKCVKRRKKQRHRGRRTKASK